MALHIFHVFCIQQTKMKIGQIMSTLVIKPVIIIINLEQLDTLVVIKVTTTQ